MITPYTKISALTGYSPASADLLNMHILYPKTVIFVNME